MPSPGTPRIPGLERTIIHPGAENDVPWIAVRSQKNADGSESHVWERWVAFSVEPLYLALYAKWSPGMIVRRHGHYSPHTITVLSGEFTCEDELCKPGSHLELPLGASFGPFVAGPEGVELYEVMMGDPRSWSDEPEAMATILAERSVEQLPDPPIELPAGLEDLRAVFSAGASEKNDGEAKAGTGTTTPRSIESAAEQFLKDYRAPDEIEADWNAWINRGGSEVWDRPGLTRAQRSIATISIMSALRDEHTLRVHLEGGLANGLSRLEISEVIMHSAVYAGVPQALRSMRIAKEVFDKLDGV